VVEVAEGLEALADDAVAGDARERRHEGDAAGVVLERGVVETLASAIPRLSRRS
jgi:hypothetical protein